MVCIKAERWRSIKEALWCQAAAADKLLLAGAKRGKWATQNGLIDTSKRGRVHCIFPEYWSVGILFQKGTFHLSKTSECGYSVLERGLHLSETSECGHSFLNSALHLSET